MHGRSDFHLLSFSDRFRVLHSPDDDINRRLTNEACPA